MRRLSLGIALLAALFAVPATSQNATDLCFGDGGDGLGCSPCPCGNEVPQGTVSGCQNPTGIGVTLQVSGNHSVTDDTLRFTAVGFPNGSNALLMSGTSVHPANPMHACFGLESGIQSMFFDGLRCLAGNIRRHGLRTANASGEIGLVSNSNGWGPPDNPAGGLIAHAGFVPGETVNFQVIYRTVHSQGCGTGKNTSQVVRLTIQP